MFETQLQNQSATTKRLKIQLLATSAIALLLSVSCMGFAWADSSQTSGNIQIKATDAIKNDPGMMKILTNIEIFKQNYAALQQKQNLLAQQNSMIDEKRKIANSYLQADLARSNNINDMSNPTNAYAGFVSKVDKSAQNVFLSEFAYMQAKVAQGKLAMSKVLQKGGTKDEALKAYYGAASTQKTELVSVNKDSNIKYQLADKTTQDLFNSNGNLKKYSAS